MNWKHWPYWVKGGMITFAIGIIFFGVLSIILVQKTCYDGGFERSCVYDNHWVYRHPKLFTSLQFSILPLIGVGIFAISFGCYGKFKSRKSKAIHLS